MWEPIRIILWSSRNHFLVEEIHFMVEPTSDLMAGYDITNLRLQFWRSLVTFDVIRRAFYQSTWQICCMMVRS
jgi:hypothetical protein